MEEQLIEFQKLFEELLSNNKSNLDSLDISILKRLKFYRNFKQGMYEISEMDEEFPSIKGKLAEYLLLIVQIIEKISRSNNLS